MSLSRCSGVYWLADLDMLQRVFDRLCNERRLAKKDREQREYLAMELFQVFDDGITDEIDLLRTFSKRRSARRVCQTYDPSVAPLDFDGEAADGGFHGQEGR
ncbi:hypothetical protein NKH24_19815 [Mesorhizobium sp. M1300]|uniref:hypothetical protein n=1 Tax=Mesorhizobium sp. M1300 TaxID=2957077 RepID=UPI0033361084